MTLPRRLVLSAPALAAAPARAQPAGGTAATE